MRGRPRFFFGQTELFLTERDTLHEESHIPCKRSHCLKSFGVLRTFAGFETVNAVPILTCRNRHAGVAEIFVEHVVRGTCSAAPTNYDARADFAGLVLGKSAVEKSVEERKSRSVGRGKINGRTDNKAVCRHENRRNLVDNIFNDAMTELEATLARHASANDFVADVEIIRLDTFSLKNFNHLVERNARVAVSFRRAVDNQNFHFKNSFHTLAKYFDASGENPFTKQKSGEHLNARRRKVFMSEFAVDTDLEEFSFVHVSAILIREIACLKVNRGVFIHCIAEIEIERRKFARAVSYVVDSVRHDCH